MTETGADAEKLCCPCQKSELLQKFTVVGENVIYYNGNVPKPILWWHEKEIMCMDMKMPAYDVCYLDSIILKPGTETGGITDENIIF